MREHVLYITDYRAESIDEDVDEMCPASKKCVSSRYLFSPQFMSTYRAVGVFSASCSRDRELPGLPRQSGASPRGPGEPQSRIAGVRCSALRWDISPRDVTGFREMDRKSPPPRNPPETRDARILAATTSLPFFFLHTAAQPP